MPDNPCGCKIEFDPVREMARLVSDKCRVAELERKNAELVAASQAIYDYIESGVLVRSIDKDGEPGWAIRMLPFVRDLKAFQDALAPKEPDHD